MSDIRKETGVSWIGEIPEDWKICKIKHVFDVFSGATPNSGEPLFWDGDINWITPADYKTVDKFVGQGKRTITKEGYDSCGTNIVPKGSIIFSKRAPIGSVAIADNDVCTNQGCLSCVPKDGVNSEYYYYVFYTAVKEFEIYGTGTTFKEISFDNFCNFLVPLPSKERQDSITVELNKAVIEIDNIISKTKASIAEYQKLRKSIVIRAVTKGLKPNVPMKQTDSDWIGEIPAHWDYVRIQRLFEEVDERNEDENALLLSLYTSIGVRPRNELEERGNKAVTVINYKKVKQNDIIVNKLLAWMGAIGYSDYEGVTSPDYDVYRAKEGANVVRTYYNEYFRHTCFNGDCYKYGHGIMLMRWRTYPEELLRIKVPNPPKEEQEAIAKYLEEKCFEIDKLIEKKQAFIEEMEQYKKSLIYEYVTGKKNVE